MMSKKTLYEQHLSKQLKTMCGNLKNKVICVCFSGGADSSALLVALAKLKEQMGFYLLGIHINHQLRGAESYRDEAFALGLAQDLCLHLNIHRVNINEYSKLYKLSIEEAARKARYEYFNYFSSFYRVDFFCTAHTMDDNVETILMNIVRGTTVIGLKGIPIINRNFIRPLLKTSKSENISYLKENKVGYIEDSSNFDNTYTRNYFRNVIIPKLSQLNPQLIKTVDRLADSVRSDEDFIDAIIDLEKENVPFKGLHPSLQRRILNSNYKEISGGYSLLTAHLEILLKLLSEGSGKKTYLPYGIVGITTKSDISFIKESSLKQLQTHQQTDTKLVAEGYNKFDNNTTFYFFYKNESVPFIIDNCLFYETVTIRASGISGAVHHRARQPGDKIRSLGRNKSIKKEFIEKDIPSYIREHLPVFFDEKGIIYVPFVGIADRVYIHDNDFINNTIHITVCVEERWDN